MSGEPLLQVRDLSVTYRRGSATLDALQSVDLEVRAGETVGLVGESGSGKSTLGRAILGLAPIGSGSVRFAGREITHAGGRERRRLARDLQAVFQDPYSSLNPSRTIGRTLAEPLEVAGGLDRQEVRRRVAEMLELVHLPRDAADRRPSEFSGGQRQRVAIARALIVEPRLVICDEPVSALDLSVQAQIVNLLQELQTASAVSYLFISHDLEVVRHLCDRVVVLYRGRVMEAGEAEQVSNAPAHPYTFAIHAAAPVPDPRLQRARRQTAAVQTSSPRDVPEPTAPMCPFAPRCPYAIERCWAERPALRPTRRDGVVACHRYPEWRDAAAHAMEDLTLEVAPGRERWSRLRATTGERG
jgi:oligopeptide/dipeptide ABC transporter ATP-binding protein